MAAILRKIPQFLAESSGYTGGMSAASGAKPSKPLALLRSAHPGPSLAITVITVGLGFGAGLDALRLTFLGLAMLAGQLSVGFSNDWIDAERDRAVGRTDKPIAQGWISVAAIRAAAWVCVGLMVVLTIPLGWASGLVLFCAVVLAWAYNLGLKKSVFSVVPYFLSFGSLPAIVTLARPTPSGAALWALGVGGLLGIAGHFANTLPDFEDDEATGVAGLPQRLGRRWSSAITYVVLLAGSVLEFFGAGGVSFLPADIGLGLSIVIAAVGIGMIARPTRLHFRLIILAAMGDVVVLVFAGTRVLA
jgi:4-hydroxybenzoate polyprenyltransferase